MRNLLGLLKNEQMKLYSRWSTWSMYIILFVLIVGSALILLWADSVDETTYGDDWEQQLTQENEEYRELNQEGDFFGFDSEIQKNEYRIENDIPPLSYDAWQFTLDNASLSTMISLFTIIVAAGIIANEFRWGTIKLLLIRPNSRTKILYTKFLSVLFFSVTMLLFLVATSFIIGAIIFGINGWNPSLIQVGADGVEEVAIFTEIITQYGFNVVNLVMMTTFAFMISTLFRNSTMAIGLAIFLMFTGNIAVEVVAKYDWAKYILFANTDLSQYFGSGSPIVESMTLGFSITVLIIYFVLFLFISWLSFSKRDVAGN
ncbi:ABC transporter permease [Gracilibacillus sp. S3-1-1]|uniref:ABC transporter permease n=1 Tax=Gracilibacillus pellucidus TaxID=3095368 RepID=A0ACC6M5X8_9BACI|nr:ABC transporter permease [Gracilibacillus sp. S3-1-1]MDX8046349.1 ABC transporter permease [Gracilibacillus sp. S3-1-1]